jgi:hypothetical protein
MAGKKVTGTRLFHEDEINDDDDDLTKECNEGLYHELYELYYERPRL